jgi:hypothetical protein
MTLFGKLSLQELRQSPDPGVAAPYPGYNSDCVVKQPDADMRQRHTDQKQKHNIFRYVSVKEDLPDAGATAFAAKH